MATVARTLMPFLVVLVACGKPVGLDAPVTPLAQVHVQTVGDPPSPAGADGGASGPQLRVALVWAMQWLPEPFCVLAATAPASLAVAPSTADDVARVALAGCRDNFGFVPARVGADAALEVGVPATLPIVSLPAADVMVGDVTGRIAYASLMVYEDRNGNGSLDLRHPQRQRRGGEPINDAKGPADAVYGASFISMTQPDRRVAYREGSCQTAVGFNETFAFYPRHGCDEPPCGFRIVSAGGFSVTDGLLSAAAGQFPAESSCGTAPVDDLVEVQLRDPATLKQLACTANDGGGVTYYRPPPSTLDLNHAIWACASFPRLGGDLGNPPAGSQLVVASSPDQPCASTLHYTLRGCNNDPACTTPTWAPDPASVPWWPCSSSP